jgi:hypothetical protein
VLDGVAALDAISAALCAGILRSGTPSDDFAFTLSTASVARATVGEEHEAALEPSMTPKSPRRLRLEANEFDERTTQAIRRPLFQPVEERARPSPLFRRVAELLECTSTELGQHLGEAMVRAESAPHAFSRGHLLDVAPAILDLIEAIVPPAGQPAARELLRQLLLQERAT